MVFNIKKLIWLLIPPKSWSRPAAIVAGAMFGLFIYLVYVSNAVSYLSDKPDTCVNCHIMAPEYATWSHSSHRQTAHCNDCHVPHNNVFNKYFFKAKDGMRHAYMFTLRLEPQTIFIKKASTQVVQQNCVRCHSDLVHNPRMLSFTSTYMDHFSNRKCWDCHRETPHGTVHSLSSVPYARIPGPESPVPDWLNSLIHD
ncbi:MAG TPA: cytochrome c nitrite reductase small subunit [Bacteroidales bacterium]|nr:cytochrome c nitrite reductase small subunit [Bacteroidales bacterium]